SLNIRLRIVVHTLITKQPALYLAHQISCQFCNQIGRDKLLVPAGRTTTHERDSIDRRLRGRARARAVARRNTGHAVRPPAEHSRPPVTAPLDERTRLRQSKQE